ncbi:MAG TPA: hypothetical protein VIY07_14175 [Pseudolabrys sp.]
MNAAGNAGVVTGSITYAGSFSGYSVLYRALTGADAGRIQTGQGALLIPYIPKGDVSLLGTRGELFAVELPAGEYEFYSWSVGSGFADVRPTSPFSVTFIVIPGKVMYVGNFHFRQTASMGLTVTGVQVDYVDRAERDLPLLSKKYPTLAAAGIDVGLERGAAYEQLGGPHATTITIPVPIPVR